MKAYLIDAGRRQIEPIDYTYNTMRNWLPGGICIAATFANGDVLYVDDEGLLKPAAVAFRVKRRPDGQPMMSNGILTGRDNPDPRSTDTLPPTSTIAALAKEIEWLDVETALDWFRERAAAPAVKVTETGGSIEVVASWGAMLANLEGRVDGYHPYDLATAMDGKRKL